MTWEVFAEVIKSWQPLIGALIAILAAFVAALIAWKNVSRQISHSAELEAKRRARKLVALRATLPLTLSAISDYADRTTNELVNLLNQCANGVLPQSGIQPPQFPATPADTIEALAEFIEYSDSFDTQLFEKLLSRIQILSARTRDISKDVNTSNGILSHWIETNIMQAASVYAAAAQAYDYARRRSDTLPCDVSWDSVRAALQNMRLYDDDLPRLYETIDRLAQQSSGPTLG